MTTRSSIVIILIQLLVSSHALNCLENCQITGHSPNPLDVPVGQCATAVANACLTSVVFNYGTRSYYVSFETTSGVIHVATVVAEPSNKLSYTVIYACIDSDSCALDFAKKKLAELSVRKYDVNGISTDLTPIVQASQKPATPLVCADNDTCSVGVCKIEFDTVSNAQKAKGCESSPARVRVTAGGGSLYGSFGVRCNLSTCNTLETLNKAKAIFAKYNLTDADGRIVGIGRGSHRSCVIGDRRRRRTLSLLLHCRLASHSK